MFGVGMGNAFARPSNVAFANGGLAVLVTDQYGLTTISLTELTATRALASHWARDAGWYPAGVDTSAGGDVLVGCTAISGQNNSVGVLRGAALEALEGSSGAALEVVEGAGYASCVPWVDSSDQAHDIFSGCPRPELSTPGNCENPMAPVKFARKDTHHVDSSDYANDAFSGFSALKILPGGLSAVAADPCKGMLHTFALGAGAARMEVTMLFEAATSEGASSDEPSTDDDAAIDWSADAAQV
ncbi:hypothetical protein T484DRAFT_1898223 [Baffinella frigidus]|nr:hypothetical protein T484DRAFT_1898223 [Cryptophyta sp. CCMP2293]